MTPAKTLRTHAEQFVRQRGKPRRETTVALLVARAPVDINPRDVVGAAAVYMPFLRATWSISARSWAPPRPGALIHNT